jgi:hypothetical protein
LVAAEVLEQHLLFLVLLLLMLEVVAVLLVLVGQAAAVLEARQT